MKSYISISVIGNVLSCLLLFSIIGVEYLGKRGNNLAKSIAAILWFLVMNLFSTIISFEIGTNVELILLFDKYFEAC